MTREADRGESRWSFWGIFAVGWLAFYLIVSVFELSREPDQVLWVMRRLALDLAPIVFGTALVASNRRRLLKPEWGIGKTVWVHAVVAVGFAVLVVFLTRTMLGLGWIDYPSESMELNTWTQLMFGVISALFFYAVFFGVLIWAESIRRVQESQRLVAREAVLRAEAEAKAVRAQFNPHFVFNTLHSLMLLVRADPAAAEKAIEDVATLIRYASIIQRKDIDTVPLAKELEVSRRYVALEQLRLGDRLAAVWTIDPPARSLVVPAFALQTLVENAVKHGIEPHPGGGHVHVTVGVEAGRLRATVADDGAGAVSDDVSEPGHGLELLARRLSARYGSDASVSWDTRPGGGFTSVLELPAEESPQTPELYAIEERTDPAAATSVGVSS